MSPGTINLAVAHAPASTLARRLLLAGGLAMAAGAAHADATFLFTVTGSGRYAGGGWLGCTPDTPDQCVRDVDWRGLLTVVTTSAADGVYDAGHVEDNEWVVGGIVRVTLASNVGGTDIDAHAYPGAQYFPDTTPYAVTIENHQVTSIEWMSKETPDDGGNLAIHGLGISFYEGQYHGAYADVSGTLAAIPEPLPASLWLLGLAGVGLAAARRRRRA